MNAKDTAERIRNLRKVKGMSQSQFAAMCGIEQGQLCNYELARIMPTIPLCERICRLCRDCDLDRLEELAKADRDERLVVLPCKVGQRVFALLDTDKHISECEVKQIGLGNEIGFVGIEPIGARGREYGVSIKGFGKTVFLTREEAEKALEAMEDV